jgi:17beta-estradiol 17-dehydrogenase / very-long-chain 3-oxoacyl-CoA reductase
MTHLQAGFPERVFRILVADVNNVACTTCLDALQSHDGLASKPLDFASIARDLDDIPLTVLVNNIGGGPLNPTFMSLKGSPEATIVRTVSMNALFPLYLTRALLPKMMQSGPSLVTNISSMSDPGLPLIASYTAAKAFLMALTRALRLEMKMEDHTRNVEVLGIRIGKVTGTSYHRGPASFLMPTTETMAKAALARAGHGNGIVVGYWQHALFQLFIDLLAVSPGWLADGFPINAMRQERDRERESRRDNHKSIKGS